MRLGKTIAGLALRDTLLALLTLALLCLNFGVADSAAASGGPSFVGASGPICGNPLMPADGSHLACHACRPNVADLPPPPCVALPVRFAASPMIYAGLDVRDGWAWDGLTAQPRGPPAA